MAKVKGLVVQVPKADGEGAKNKLREAGALDPRRIVSSDSEYVYIPVLEEIEGFENIEYELEEKALRKSFKDLLAEKFGGEVAGGILSSYDVVGDIAIIQIPKEISKHEEEIGELLLRADNKIKVVLKKAGGREGEFRITKLVYLAGEKRTETEYVENGVRMRLDVAKAYFSPRLGTERKRIMDEVGDKENVLILFAGVGPFALEIGKKKPNAKVVGIELNPEAVKYFKENIRLNKLKNVSAELGDAKKVVKEKFASWADRIAMPLPMGAEEFLDSAFLAAKPGCIIHFYKLLEKEGGFEKAKGLVEAAAKKADRNIEFIFEKEVRPYSAAKAQVVLDFRVD